MSTLQIEERITVHAPPKRVWKFLLDPARVAACLPGAKLDGTEGEDTFLGTMKIKVGPVVMEIKGKATMSHIDPVERRVTLSGTGNDKAGGGSARMDMKSQILEVEGGGSEILVHADVHLAGKLVRFGRGMMEGISKQLFKQFAERVHAALDEDDDDEEEEHVEEAAAAPAAPAEPAPAPEAKAPAVEAKAPAPEAKAPAPEATAEPAAVEKAPPTAPEGEPATAEKAPPAEAPAVKEASMPGAAAEKAPPAEAAAVEKAPPAEAAAVEKAPPAEPEGEPAAVEKASQAEPTDAEKAPLAEPAAAAEAGPAKAEKAPTALAPVRKKKATKKPVVAPADNAPLDAGGLVWAAIWAWIKGLFARIFSR